VSITVGEFAQCFLGVLAHVGRSLGWSEYRVTSVKVLVFLQCFSAFVVLLLIRCRASLQSWSLLRFILCVCWSLRRRSRSRDFLLCKLSEGALNVATRIILSAQLILLFLFQSGGKLVRSGLVLSTVQSLFLLLSLLRLFLCGSSSFLNAALFGDPFFTSTLLLCSFALFFESSLFFSLGGSLSLEFFLLVGFTLGSLLVLSMC